jgi:hypothetical protein
VQEETVRSLQQTISEMALGAAGSRADQRTTTAAEQLASYVTRLHAAAAEALQKLKTFASSAAAQRRQLLQKDDRIRELLTALEGQRKATPQKGTLSLSRAVSFSAF